MSDELCQLGITEAADGIKAGKFSSEELVRACLARIERFDAESFSVSRDLSDPREFESWRAWFLGSLSDDELEEKIDVLREEERQRGERHYSVIGWDE